MNRTQALLHSGHLVKRPLILTLVITGLAALASLAGLIFPDTIYPTEELRNSLAANDVVTLVLGLPILLGAAALGRRGNLAGQLYWPGALLFLFYNYLIYTIALAPAAHFLVYLVLVVLSGYSIYLLISVMDGQEVMSRVAGAVPARLAGAVLAGFGLLFFFWRGVLLVENLTGRLLTPPSELATMIADVLVSPAWVWGGVLLCLKRPAGYLVGGGLLFQFGMLFIGLLAFFVLQPVLFGVAFAAEDFVSVLGMAILCLVPVALYTRGVTRAAKG